MLRGMRLRASQALVEAGRADAFLTAIGDGIDPALLIDERLLAT